MQRTCDRCNSAESLQQDGGRTLCPHCTKMRRETGPEPKSTEPQRRPE